MRLASRLLGPALVCLVLVAATPAAADLFGPISLVSRDATPAVPEANVEQVLYAHDAAISGNGRYVAFDGYFAGETGVWRRDLLTGAVAGVAVGAPKTPAGSAQRPSISANGQYVSFTTTAPLAPHRDTNVAPDVYVRDMNVAEAQTCEEEGEGPPPAPCAFTLVSAANGSEQGLSYSYGANPEEPRWYGSIASGRSAISADGNEVVFVTTARSSLVGAETPALQVALRDIAARATRLVSAEYDRETGRTVPGRPVSGSEGATSFGAVYAGRTAPPPFRAPEAFEPPSSVGASISADGSTVAWLGQDVGEQAPTLADEPLLPGYAEPLWRRVADGEEAPTRRVTGGSDPASAACQESHETAVSPNTPSLSDPCQGPFATFVNGAVDGTWHLEEGEVAPQLSADGYTVAFLANAPLVSSGEDFGNSEVHSDLYVANMHPGLTRVQALRRLTELASGNNADLATNGRIMDLAISPDGAQVAFATKRTAFPLGSPAFVSAPAAQPGMAELFEADLQDDTLTRVSQGIAGEASERSHAPAPSGEDPYRREGDGALSPSFSTDGGMLAFASTADNLVADDGNTPPVGRESNLFDGSDAFVVSREQIAAVPTESYVTSPPGGPAITPLWMLSATASSQRDGSVILNVVVPAAGTLTASAAASVQVQASAARGRRAGHASAGRHGRKRVVTASVAANTVKAQAGGLMTVRLRLAPRYGALAATRGGLQSTVALTFAAPGHPWLKQSLEVRFVRTIRQKAHRARAHRGRAR